MFTMPPAIALLNYLTIRELYHTLADFFPNRDFSRGFLDIPYISPERSSDAAMGGAGGRAAPSFAFQRA
jgi:hypothetical protein